METFTTDDERARKQAFGLHLKRLRLEAGQTVNESSTAARVTRTTWNHWERGRQTPRPWRLLAIANALAIPVASLLVDDVVLAEVRVSPETLARVKREGMPAAQEAAERIASSLAPLLLAEATRPPVDVSPGARPKRRRSRREVLAGVREAERMSKARRAAEAEARNAARRIE